MPQEGELQRPQEGILSRPGRHLHPIQGVWEGLLVFDLKTSPSSEFCCCLFETGFLWPGWP